jgi:hypothetical protein
MGLWQRQPRKKRAGNGTCKRCYKQERKTMAHVQQAVVHMADLRVYGRSYHSTWTEHGVIAHAYLEPLQDNDSSRGYQLDFLTSREAGPGKLGSRQERSGSELIGQIRQRMIAEMQATGWRVVGSYQGKEVCKRLPTSDVSAPRPVQVSSVEPKTTRGCLGSPQKCWPRTVHRAG